ncbi:hypothetical protein QBC42DRAFT_351264 [Cladorrhinum samala]|uniref:Uncharacterized protein n=1 Tax=Cladorrhinum samala TaxID=585594 RepID=A0AAV9H981_9PEZI|nr:hypothetical protein QBC42DRAFT_351264 [Cladorrhinum samala]
METVSKGQFPVERNPIPKRYVLHTPSESRESAGQPFAALAFIPEVQDRAGWDVSMGEAWEDCFTATGIQSLQITDKVDRRGFSLPPGHDGRIYSNHLGGQLMQWWDNQLNARDYLATELRAFALEYRKHLNKIQPGSGFDSQQSVEWTELLGRVKEEVEKWSTSAGRERSLSTTLNQMRHSRHQSKELGKQELQAAQDRVNELESELQALRTKHDKFVATMSMGRIDSNYDQDPAGPPRATHKSDKWMDVRVRHLLGAGANRNALLRRNSTSRNCMPAAVRVAQLAISPTDPRKDMINSQVHGGDLLTDLLIAESTALVDRHGQGWADWFRQALTWSYGGLAPVFFADIRKALDPEDNANKTWFASMRSHVYFANKYVTAREIVCGESRNAGQMNPPPNLHDVARRIKASDAKFEAYMAEFGRGCADLAHLRAASTESEADLQRSGTLLADLDCLRWEVFDALSNWASTDPWTRLESASIKDMNWRPGLFLQTPDPKPPPGSQPSAPPPRPSGSHIPPAAHSTGSTSASPPAFPLPGLQFAQPQPANMPAPPAPAPQNFQANHWGNQFTGFQAPPPHGQPAYDSFGNCIGWYDHTGMFHAGP